MRAVGYRQAWQYLREEINYPDLVSSSLAATRQLGKRQLTWLRSMPERHIIACDSTDPTAQALTLVQRFTAEGL